MMQKAQFWILFTASFANAYYMATAVKESDVVTCGLTIEEARSRGCKFDMYSFGYYPPACYHHAHHEEFLAAHRHEIQWTLTDQTPIPVTETLEGKHMNLFTTSSKFHDLHCTYEWQRLVRALAEQRPLDKKLSEVSHSWHCSQKLLAKDRSDRLGYGSEANVLLGACGLTPAQMYEYGETAGP